MSSQKKKFEKKKAREKKKREEKIQNARESLYPEIVIDGVRGSPEFVALISETVKSVKLSDAKFFSEGEQLIYKAIRKEGFESVFLRVNGNLADNTQLGGEEKAGFISTIVFGYGERLFRAIPEEERKRHLPINNASVCFKGKSITIKLDSLLSQKSEMGTIYFSRKRPQMKFGEETFTAAFSRHAIERICERQNPKYLTYTGLGDAFAFFGGCVYFRPVFLHDGQPAFVIYNVCDNPSFKEFHTYTKQVLGVDKIKSGEGGCYYLVGYCPVVLEKGFAKAKTFLIPGYTGTPEYNLLLSANIPKTEKQRLLGLAKDATEEHVHRGENLELIKWFHDNGVPQVVQMRQKVFDYT